MDAHELSAAKQNPDRVSLHHTCRMHTSLNTAERLWSSVISRLPLLTPFARWGQFDTHMSITVQVNSLVSSCNCQIHQLGTIRKYVSATTCHKAVLALVPSCLDYCNVLLNVIPGYQMGTLQKVKCALCMPHRVKQKGLPHQSGSLDPLLPANLPEGQVQDSA